MNITRCLSPAVFTLSVGLILTNLSAPALRAELAKPKLNVLFIAVDDLRPEMGCYGNPLIQTPHLNRIAARGIVFDRAYCQQAVCSPSRSSIMTGRRPDATRVYDLKTHFRVALPNTVTLPQYFKNNGYYCLALGKIYHRGFEDGGSWNEPHWYPFGMMVDTAPGNWSKHIVTKIPGVTESENLASPEDEDRPTATGAKKGDRPAFEVSGKSDDQLPDGFTAAEVVRRLHGLKQKGQPFFLAVGFAKPHLPFVAPKKYWDLYDPEKIPKPVIDHLPEGAPAFAGHSNGELHSYSNIPSGNPIPDRLAKQLRHGYYACISYVDAQIGRLLDALEHEGLADNTVIVVWGDHGWQLGDHGLWHKHTNFEQAARSPLLISVPGLGTAGRKCEAPVEFVDVYPTLADMCGLEVPAGLDGISLKPWLADPATVKSKVALSQYPRTVGGRRVMGYSIRDERWRLTLWRDQDNQEIVATELYDEQNDPAETINQATKVENRGVIESLSKWMPAPVDNPPEQGTGTSKKARKKARATSS